MARITRKYVKWKVTLDGVEVPWQNISLATGMDFPGKLEVTIEPDPVLKYLRPGTKVHLWMYDKEPPREKDLDIFSKKKSSDEDDDLDRLFMFWEGELRSPTYMRQHSVRSFSIVAEGEFAAFGRTKLFAHGFGGLPSTHLVSGSLLYPSEILTAKQMISYTMFGKAMDPKIKNVIDQEILYRDTEEPNYAGRLLRYVAYLSSFNANFRMQITRSNMFGKIVAFDDEVLGKLLPRVLVSDYFTQGNSKIPSNATMLDLINAFNKLIFYHYASTPGPVVPSSGPVDEVSYINMIGMEKPSDDLYSIQRRFLRNDYFLLPEMYYAIPPSCNLIFPEFVNSFSLGRDFMSEPTRMLMFCNQLGVQLPVVAPDSLFRFEKKPDAAQFFSLNKDGIKREGAATSPYHVRGKEDILYNLFGAVSDEEIEKGVLPIADSPDFEFFAAVANTYDLRTEKGRDELDSVTKSLPQMFSEVVSKSTTKNAAFVYLMKALADHSFVLNKFRRNVSVGIIGHRWIVPGFSCVILDTNTSYIGLVKSYSLSIGPSGDEMGTIGLDYVRPFPVFDRKVAEKIEKKTRMMNKANVELGKLESEVDNFVRQLKEAEFGYSFPDATEKDKKRNIEKMRKLFNTVYEAVRRDPNMQNKIELDAMGLDRIRTNLSSAMDSRIGDGMKSAYFAGVRYAAALREAAKSAVASWDPKKAPNAKIGSRIGDLSIAISKVSLDDPFPEDFMPPPVFGNPDLLSVKKAETIYSEVIGAQKVFGDKPGFPEISSKDTSLSGSANRVLALREQSYTKLLNYAKALNDVFPVLGEQGTDGNSEWEQRSTGGESDESVRDWIEEKFLKRKRLQSLRDFLKVNGLKLQKARSDPPTQMQFLHFVPSHVFTYPSECGMDLVWDNTLFSKIVDEFRIQRKTFHYKDEQGVVHETSKSVDSEIRKLRKSVKSPFLTTKARQEVIIEYSRKHFGSRAFED